jgi:hypothetical protein
MCHCIYENGHVTTIYNMYIEARWIPFLCDFFPRTRVETPAWRSSDSRIYSCACAVSAMGPTWEDRYGPARWGHALLRRPMSESDT